MFDTIQGLPVHALVVHAVVVLVPLSAVGVLAIAAVPRWRERFGTLVLLVSTGALVTVPVATRSGQDLKERVGASGVVARQIDDHQEIGELVLWPTLGMEVLAIALVALSRRRAAKGAVTAVAVLAAVAAVAAAGLVLRAGHLGSTAVWSCTVGSDACK